jgi:hypothetical protein
MSGVIVDKAASSERLADLGSESSTSRVNCFRKVGHEIWERVQVVASRCIKSIQYVHKIFDRCFIKYLGSKFVSPLEILLRTIRFIAKKILKIPTKSFKEEIFETGYNLKPHLLDATHKEDLEKLHDAIFYARMYASVHKTNNDPDRKVHPVYMPPNLEVACDIRDEKNALRMTVFHDRTKVYVVYGAAAAVGDKFKKKNLLQSAANFFGLRPQIFKEANDCFEKFKKENPGIFEGREIVFSGQCLGASLASYVSLNQDEKAVLLNPFGLGAGFQRELLQKLPNASEKIEIYSVESDITSHPFKPLIALDFLINLVGIKTIGSFGKRYLIKPPKSIAGSIDKVHCLILVSLFDKLGYNVPKEESDLVTFFLKYDQLVLSSS